ncbi:hypothetical protein F2Q68_00007746 [Brassica cretica]|uniref:Uncharacterized protein n=1 Tax=Brassica cretica TaxID=69181 RepID=A0A8S9L3E3_BRACR|nr:hypothetical protein F2Q68_00007746 [Brassica cretica]
MSLLLLVEMLVLDGNACHLCIVEIDNDNRARSALDLGSAAAFNLEDMMQFCRRFFAVDEYSGYPIDSSGVDKAKALTNGVV